MLTRQCKVLLALLLCLVCCFGLAQAAEEKHPSLITISGGQSIGNGAYINHNDSGYPFIAEVELTEQTIPLESCQLGVYSWDCDWDSTGSTHEYDMVYVNDTFVGVLTGVNGSWKTTYMNVPIELLKVGKNTIKIYVGHMEHASGQIVQNTDIWLLEVKWLSLQMDGGESEEAPEKFDLSLSYATRSAFGIECGAQVLIESDKSRSYVVEYSLVDKTGSANHNQIIAGDSDAVSGSSITSTGSFFLNSNAPMGSYEIQATLRDPLTNEVFAYTSKTFDLGSALEGSCKHVQKAPETYVRTEISRLSKDAAAFASKHQAIDQYQAVCEKCGETFHIYRNSRQESHNLPVCSCGFVEEGHNSIYSATFSPMQNGCAGESFSVSVVTDDFVTRIEASNSADFPMSGEWIRQDNGDGTLTWTKIYTANVVTKEQYWNVTVYGAGNVNAGSMRTNVLEIKEAGTVKPGSLLDSITKTGNYTLTILDGDTGEPVSGAQVVLMGVGGTTDANGRVQFPRKSFSGKGTLVVKAKEYFDYSVDKYALGVGQSIDVIQIYKECPAKIVPMTCNEDNISTGTAQLNVKADLEAKIIVSGKVASYNKIVDYKLLQNGMELATSTDGKFEVHNAKFIEGALVTVQMQVKNGANQISYVEEPLNITVVSQGLGNWLNLDGIPVLQKLDLGVKGLPDLIGNFDFKFYEKKSSSVSGKREVNGGFDDVKIDNYAITAGLGVDISQDFQKINSKLREQNKKLGWAKQSGMSFEPAFSARFAFNKDGVYETTASLGVKASGYIGKEHTIPNVLWGIPLNVEWKFNASVGIYGSNIGYNWNSKKWTIPSADLKFSGGVYGAAGPGCKFANAGIYGEGALNADGSISITAPVSFSASGYITGEIGLKAKLEVGILSWNGSLKLWEFKSDPFRIGKSQNRNTFSAAAAPVAPPLSQYPLRAGSLTLSDVGYTSTPITEEQPFTVLEEGVEALSDVQMAAVGESMVMAYAVNDSTGDAQWGHIVYRVWDGAAWSVPAPLTASALPQGDFSLRSDGDKLWIAYVQMKRSVDPASVISAAGNLASLEAMAGSILAPCEILVAEYDPASKTFLDRGALTDDEAYDGMPALAIIDGKPCVAWMKDPANSLFAQAGQNSLYLAVMADGGIWQTEEIAHQLPMVAQLEAGVLDGQLTAAAVTDNDNDQTTLDDRKLTVYGKGFAQDMAAGQVSQPVFGIARQTQSLIWYQDGMLMQQTGLASAPDILLDENHLVPAAYQLATGSERSYLLFTVYDAANATRQIAGIDLNDANADAVLMTNLPGYVDSFGAIMHEDGLTFALIRTDAVFTEDSMVTVSDLCTTFYGYQQALELLALDWSTLDFYPGETAPLTAYVSNLGSEYLTEVLITLTGAVEGEATVSVSIAPGTVAEVPFTCTLPEVLSGEIGVTVSLPGVNGSQSVTGVVSLEYVDFCVDASQIVVAGKQQLLYSVQNIGSLAGKAVMKVRAGDAEGEVLFTKDIALDAFMAENDLLPMDELLARISGEGSKLVYVEVVAEDILPENNGVFVTFYMN